MEDGSDDLASSAVIPSPINNGETEGMANFPNSDSAPTSPLKVNGDSNLQEPEPAADNEEKDSSDCDALVIDEGVKPPKKKTKVDEEFRHTNPYFSESIFELSSQYKPQDNPSKGNVLRKLSKGNGKKFRGKNGKPKLREYAQYLGLQPTVQFKCSKCLATGFQSLQTLNEHLTNCTSIPPVDPPAPLLNNATNFRVTRKVFLCSACGTYYENWNLFLHIREVHKRFICLYCLGMFPHADKLSLHLVSKHNCCPHRYDNITDFFNIYKDPCFLLCCDCQTVFNEQENFIDHGCVEREIVRETVNNDEEVNSDQTEAIEPPVLTTGEQVESVPKEENADSTNLKQKQTLVNVVAKEPKPSCGNNKESDSSSEINMIENENTQETSDNSAEDRLLETDDHVNPSEDLEDNVNMDSPDNKGYVSDDSDDNKMNENSDTDEPDVVSYKETEERKVPKVTLRLPKITTPYNPTEGEEEDDDYQSEDSEKLTMEIEKENSDVEVTNEHLEDENCEPLDEYKNEICVPTAGVDIAIIELELEHPLDKFDIKLLLQKCLGSTITTCLYCNHARKIAVNGKQLGLHAIAEHRYSAIVKSITAEELIPESFNTRIKESLDELEHVFFNLESTSSEGGITFSHIFECFQCRYSTTIHKELYLHNRKLHSKAILLCIMCKTSFYSYCELICHLCPGIYALENDVQFRCCLCVSDDLPSAFRLMVHLRKKHHVCDVCLEMCHDQSRLSNHVWKHKLHHLCYRCGIAYRNKPDITKHLFWKHGTESVLCKKCMQKKWPHVYHFCIPPGSFSCEECNMSFTRAVSLMVHKRLHTEIFPHACSEEGCVEKFVSKKLLTKHEYKHRPPIEEPKIEEEIPPVNAVVKECSDDVNDTDKVVKEKVNDEVIVEEKLIEKPKLKVDVYDLPELNLSESDSSDSEDENQKADLLKYAKNNILGPSQDDILKTDAATEIKQDLEDKPIPVLENIWDDFKNYQANIAKLDILTDVGKDLEAENEEPGILTDVKPPVTHEEALRDHDYCATTMDTLKEEEGLPNNHDMSADHDYCSANEQKEEKKNSISNNLSNNKKQNSSDSSSNSDSSSCTCGSNCSCSSASSSSSSSSDSSESDSSSEEGRRRQQVRREKRRQKKTKKVSENTTVDVEAVATDNNAPQPMIPLETPILETDLETTESDTDEDFYDKQPQKLASKLLAEKRQKLLQMAGIGPYINGSMIDSRPSTPNLMECEVKPKKKSKSKKKKKRKSSKHDMEAREANHVLHHYPTVTPLTLTLSKNSPISTPIYSPPMNNLPVNSNLQSNPSLANESDSNTRASKRRRVPNKFYGYSSDEDAEKATPMQQAFKLRKVELPTPKSPLIVPPLTIKTAPSTPTVEPISIRMSAKPGEMKVQPLRLPFTKRSVPKLKPMKPPRMVTPQEQQHDTGTDSNSSSSEDESAVKVKEQPALYCYCRCPYDEVSEMIGCDSDDCAIEWFHFECVGIMVPPKGQWYCPDCRKKKQQRREIFQAQMSS